MSTSITASISDTQVITDRTSAAPAFQLSDGTTLNRVGNGKTDGDMDVVISLSDGAVAYLNALPSDVLNFLVNDWQSFDPTPSATNTTGISTTGTVQTQLTTLEQSWINTINDPEATDAAKLNAFATYSAVANLLDNVPSSIGGGVVSSKFDTETANSAFVKDVVDPTSLAYGEYGFNLVQSGQQFLNESEFAAEGQSYQGEAQAVWSILQNESWGVSATGITNPTQSTAGGQLGNNKQSTAELLSLSVLSSTYSSVDLIDNAIAQMLESSDAKQVPNASPAAASKTDITS